MNARRGGFVLIAALWLLVALGAVGLDAALRSRTLFERRILLQRGAAAPNRMRQ